MQNPMSSVGILGKFMKKKSTEVEERETVSQLESFLQQEWQGGGRCRSGSLWATGREQAGLKGLPRLFDDREENWGRFLEDKEVDKAPWGKYSVEKCPIWELCWDVSFLGEKWI